MSLPIGDLNRLEYILISHFRPTFLFIEPPNELDQICIIISCIKFNMLPIEGRIAEIFTLLNNTIPDILQRKLLIVQAYNSDEMEEILVDIFKYE